MHCAGTLAASPARPDTPRHACRGGDLETWRGGTGALAMRKYDSEKSRVVCTSELVREGVRMPHGVRGGLLQDILSWQSEVNGGLDEYDVDLNPIGTLGDMGGKLGAMYDATRLVLDEYYYSKAMLWMMPILPDTDRCSPHSGASTLVESVDAVVGTATPTPPSEPKSTPPPTTAPTTSPTRDYPDDTLLHGILDTLNVRDDDRTLTQLQILHRHALMVGIVSLAWWEAYPRDDGGITIRAWLSAHPRPRQRAALLRRRPSV
jgi:hypothetical protein